MKKQKTKKKLNKTRTPELDAAAKFAAQISKEAAGLQPLNITPQAPLGTEVHHQD